MALPLWINNLIAYSLQIAILAAVGTLLVHVFRLRMPRVTLIYWQILLLACLFVPFLQRWEHPAFSPVISEDVSVSVTPAISDDAVPIDLKPPTHVPWGIFALILAAGILVRLIWLIIGFFRLRLFQRRAYMFLEGHAVVQDMQWRTGVRVPLLLSGEIDSPVTFGFRSPIIILPLSFKDLSEPCQKAVLCHELLHVRRYDWILIIVEEVVCSLFWFHPAIWWLRSRIQLSREQAVDHGVVQLTGSKQPYLDSLLEFAQAHGRPRGVPATLFLKERHLVQRVALLIKEVSMSRSRLAVSLIGISILLAWTVRLAAGWFPLTGAPVPAQEQGTNLEINAPKRAPIRVGANLQESKLISKVEPIYPEQAKRERIEGTIKLTIIVNEEGLVYEIKTAPGNNPLLEGAAISSVEQWRYSPTFLNGEPVSIETSVMVLFELWGNDDKAAQMDESGDLNKGLGQSAKIEAKAAPVSIPGQYANPEVKAPQRTAFRVGGDAQESKLVYKVNPRYPEQAKRERLEGTVQLEVTINEEGFVSGIIAAPGNYEVLEDAAIAAVKQWRYSPTYLNGEPVPVAAPVTVIYRLRDNNDLPVMLDESGNLNRELSQILQATGTVELRIAPTAPFRVVENAIRELTQKGVHKIKLSLPFALYQGQLFYAGMPTNAQQISSGIDGGRLVSIARASGQFEKGKPYRFIYRLYLNQAGEAVGLQRLGGAEIPEIEQELMHIRQTPALIGSDPVPFMTPVGIHFIG